jgi:hypothetical protein
LKNISNKSQLICTRLDIWAERNKVLSPMQYGFSKGKGTKDCPAILTTDINNSFEMKEQTVAAFLDISRAYDNVILCEVMVERELSIHIIRLLWNLLKKKKLVLYVHRCSMFWIQRFTTGIGAKPISIYTASLGQM